MKKRVLVFFIALILLVFLVGFASAFPFSALRGKITGKAVSNSEGVVSYYDFEGSLADKIAGDTGTGNNISFVDGKVGKAVLFGGVNSWANLGPKFNFGDSKPFTVMAWMYADKAKNYAPILAKVAANRATSSYPKDDWILLTYTNGYMGAYSSQSAWVLSSSASVLGTGKWYHLTYSFNGSSMSFYVNGTFAGSKSFTYKNNASNNAYLGSWYNTAAGTYDLAGKIDEMKVWNRALSASEIKKEYDSDLNPVIPPKQFCNDSDGGLDYYVKGKASATNGVTEDFCVNSMKLNEAICNVENSSANAQYDCPNGCADGACLIPAKEVDGCSFLSSSTKAKIIELQNWADNNNTYYNPYANRASEFVVLKEGEKIYKRDYVVLSDYPYKKLIQITSIVNNTDIQTPDQITWKNIFTGETQIVYATTEGTGDINLGGYVYTFVITPSPSNMPSESRSITLNFPQTTGNDKMTFYCNYASYLCSDSDAGKDYYVKGSFSGVYNDTLINNQDACLDPERWDNTYTSDWLGEAYCENNEIKIERYNCPNGCADGACLKPACSNLIEKVKNPPILYSGFGDFNPNGNDSYRTNFWLDGNAENATVYYAYWGNNQGSEYKNIDYNIYVFDNENINLDNLIESNFNWNLCSSETYSDNNGKKNVVYLCKGIYDFEQQQSYNLRGFWVNGNVLVQFYVSSGRQLTQDEILLMQNEKVTDFIDQLKNNRGTYVDLYLQNPFLSIIRDDLNLCGSELVEMRNPETNETCSPCWSCKIEPVICPEHGFQTRTCIDYCCRQENREYQEQCSPGMCSGCMIPRWLNSNSGNNICVPYGTRLAYNNAGHKEKSFMSEILEGIAQAKEEGYNFTFEITPENTIHIVFDSAYPFEFTANGEKRGFAGDEAYVYAGERYNIEFTEGNRIEKYSLTINNIHYSGNIDEQYFELTLQDNFDAYCNYDGRIYQQKVKDYDGSWAKCQNNYECDSNLCSGGECVEINDMLRQTSVLKSIGIQVLCKLASLFGIEESYESCVANYLG